VLSRAIAVKSARKNTGLAVASGVGLLMFVLGFSSFSLLSLIDTWATAEKQLQHHVTSAF